MERTLCILILLLILPHTIKACICADKPAIDTYDYIALVQIIGVVEDDTNAESEDFPVLHNHQIIVRTLTQYKGDMQRYISVSGGNVKYNLGYTSCDMGADIGEQWIIFGNKSSGAIHTGYCSRSMHHMSYTGEIDYVYNTSTELIRKLNRTYLNINFSMPDGYYTEYYNNSKTQLLECYEDNKLEGHRKVYYRDGTLKLEEYYVDGKRDGYQKRYMHDGTLSYEGRYSQGKKVGTHYMYGRQGRTSIIRYFSEDGTYICTERFKYDPFAR